MGRRRFTMQSSGLFLGVAVSLLSLGLPGCAQPSREVSQQAQIEELREEVQQLRAQIAAPEAREQHEPVDESGRIQALLKTLEDGDILAQYRATRELVKMGPAATPSLVQALASDDRSLRRGALIVLARTRNERALPALLDVAREHPGDTEKALALIALGRIGTPAAEEAALRALEDESEKVRVAAIRALADVKSEKAVGQLAQLLTVKKEVVRAAAKRALMDICEDAFPGVAALYGGSSTETKVHLIDLLSQLHNDDAEEGLLAALEDNNVALRLLAAQALVNRGNRQGISVAEAYLNSENAELRQRAIQILEKAGYKVHFDTTSGKFVLPGPDTKE